VEKSMSIYATLWKLKFPRHGNLHSQCEWETVIGQSVPAHIGTPSPGHGYEQSDPYESFLPPAVPIPDDDDGTALRAVVIVREGTEKVGQEYVHPLLTLSGREYQAMTFVELHRRICDALRGNRPQCVVEFLSGDGDVRVFFDDGSVREVFPIDEPEETE
jgi:hypothetical protein